MQCLSMGLGRGKAGVAGSWSKKKKRNKTTSKLCTYKHVHNIDSTTGHYWELCCILSFQKQVHRFKIYCITTCGPSDSIIVDTSSYLEFFVSGCRNAPSFQCVTVATVENCITFGSTLYIHKRAKIIR